MPSFAWRTSINKPFTPPSPPPNPTIKVLLTLESHEDYRGGGGGFASSRHSNTNRPCGSRTTAGFFGPSIVTRPAASSGSERILRKGFPSSYVQPRVSSVVFRSTT